jgi:hypothetical protein
MYASSFHIGKKTLSFVKGVARSAAIGARVAGAPWRHLSPDMVPSMDPGAPTQAQPEPLPLPPPPPPPPSAPPSAADPDGAQWVESPKLAGQLSPVWRLVFGFGWAAIVVGNAAVWETSRVIGLSTWWLGADSEPRLLLFQLVPFYGPILVAIAAISNWRYAPYLGIVVAVAGAGIGAGDLNRVRWIATVELVLAGAALCISVASLVGMYRPARSVDPLS